MSAAMPQSGLSSAASALIALDNPYPQRDYQVECSTPELTCVCPVTGQPDVAPVEISYTPGPKIVELKSLKLYLWGYRDQGIHHETITNQILTDLVELLEPKAATVVTRWLVRGGITTVVTAEHGAA